MNAIQELKFKAPKEVIVDEAADSIQPAPSTSPDSAIAETAPVLAGAEAPTAQPRPINAAPAIQQQIPISDPQLREIDFPKFDLAVLESMSESARLVHADSMELHALGCFIRPALVGIKRLVEAYRPYILHFMRRTAHQGEQKLLTNGKGEPADRDEVVRELLGVGVRRINQLLATTDPKTPKPKLSLTPTQDAVVQALVGQGYKAKDAVAMVKAAEGNDFDSLFRSALAHRAGGGGTGTPVNKCQEELDDDLESDEPQTSEPETEVVREEETPVIQPSGDVTYEDWETFRKKHPLPPASAYRRKYFAKAAANFVDRYFSSFCGSAFEKSLAMLKDKPDQVRANADDFARLATVLRYAAEHANLLAAAISSAVNPEASEAEALGISLPVRAGDEVKSPTKQKVSQLETEIRTLRTDLVQVRGQMQQIIEAASETPHKTCGELLAWMNEQG